MQKLLTIPSYKETQVPSRLFGVERKLFPELENRKPFLKWAGGKSQLIPELLKYIPSKFNKYIEPFIGGGALFFGLNHSNSVISDSNEELIITYNAVRDHVHSIVELLDRYVNDEKFFYQIRSFDPLKLTNIERAARLIFLNKTCFNGLYRVNKKGMFNVPYNKRKNEKFYNKATLINASLTLQNTTILLADYKAVLNQYARKDDLVFLDPPYQPIGKYSDFKRYTKEFFYEKDQHDLLVEFKKLIDKGCFVLLTNSNHPMIIDLYKDFRIEVIETRRLISSNPNTRTGQDIIVLGGI